MDLFDLEIDPKSQVNRRESRKAEEDLGRFLLLELGNEKSSLDIGSAENSESPRFDLNGTENELKLDGEGIPSTSSTLDSNTDVRERTTAAASHAIDTFIPGAGDTTQQPFIVTGGRDNRVHVFAIDQDMTPLYSLGDNIGNGHSDMVTCLKTYQPPDKGPTLIISGSRDRSIRIWIVVKRSCYKVLKGHQDTVWCLDVVSMPDTEPLIVSGGIDGFVIVWSLLRGERLREIFLGVDTAIFCLRVYKFQGAPMVLFGGENEMVSLWSIESGEVIRTYQGHNDAVHCVDVLYNYAGDPHPDYSVHSQMDDLMVSGGRDKQVIVWSVTTGVPLRTLQWHSGAVFSLAFKPLLTGRRQHKCMDDPCDTTCLHLYDLKMESKMDIAPTRETPHFEDNERQTQRETKEDREARQLSDENSFRAMYGDRKAEGGDDFIPDFHSPTQKKSFVERWNPFHSNKNKKKLDYRNQDNSTTYVVEAIIISSDKLGTVNVSSLNTGACLMSSTHHHGAILSTAVVTTQQHIDLHVGKDTGERYEHGKQESTNTSMKSDTKNYSVANDDTFTSEATEFQHELTMSTVYTVGVEKKIIAERFYSHYSAAMRAYEKDKSGTLPPVKILNTVPEKYREWSNVYLTALKHAPSLDAFFACETFLLFHLAILDEKASFLEAFLDNCPTGLVLSSYYQLKHHGYDIHNVNGKRDHARLVAFFAKGKKLLKKWIGFPESRSTLSQFSLLRTALDFLDFNSVSLILSAWVNVLNSSNLSSDNKMQGHQQHRHQVPEAWMSQYCGGFTRLLVDDVVLCANLKPLLFFDAFLSKIQVRPCHPNVTRHATTRLINKENFLTKGVDSNNFQSSIAIWDESVRGNGGGGLVKDLQSMHKARDVNLGFYLPLPYASDPRLIRAHVQATRALGASSVEIYASAAVDIGMKHVWNSYLWKTHAITLIIYIIMFLCYVTVELSDYMRDISIKARWTSKAFLIVFAVLELFREVLSMIWSENIFHFLGFRPILTILFVVCIIGSSSSTYGKTEDHEDVRTFSIALAITAFWLKLVDLLRPLPLLGSIIATVGSVTYSTRYLIIIIIISVVAFAFSFWILCAPTLYIGNASVYGNVSLEQMLQDRSPFSNLLRSLEFTYTFALGQYDTTAFDYCGAKIDGSINPDIVTFCILMSIIFMILVTVLMLNVLIALMTNTYSRITEQGLAQTRFEQCTFMVDYGILVDSILCNFKEEQLHRNMKGLPMTRSATSGIDVYNPRILFTLVSKAHRWSSVLNSGNGETSDAEKSFTQTTATSAASIIDSLTNYLDTENSEILNEQGAILDALEERLGKLTDKRNRK